MSIGNVSSFAPGKLIAQLQPTVTTPVALFTTGALRTELVLLLVRASAPCTVDVFHDDTGTAYAGTNQIIEHAILAGALSEKLFQAQYPGTGIMIAAGGSIGVAASVANTATFSAYAVTESVAQQRVS